MCSSKRPGRRRAASSASRLFVQATTNTCGAKLLVDTPSISFNKVDKTRDITSTVSESVDRLVATASISSKNKTHGAADRARANNQQRNCHVHALQIGGDTASCRRSQSTRPWLTKFLVNHKVHGEQ
eukprot:scaffold2518_cov178-Amphora_coffeaeformis.AAC.20